jgi:hypothetical protein
MKHSRVQAGGIGDLTTVDPSDTLTSPHTSFDVGVELEVPARAVAGRHSPIAAAVSAPQRSDFILTWSSFGLVV